MTVQFSQYNQYNSCTYNYLVLIIISKLKASIYIYILAEKPAFGGLHCYGALLTEALRRRVWGNAKFVSPMYKYTPMLPFCYGTVHIRVSSCEASCILQNGGTFFYVVDTQHLVAKLRIAS